MDVSQDPPLMAMDLSKGFTPLSRADAADLSRRPEWYHRRPASCSAAGPSAFRASCGPRAQQGVPVRRRDPDPLGGYMGAAVAPGLDLFHSRTHGGLWPGGYGGPVPESSGADSDSGSDVIFLVSSAKEPLLCGSFLPDGARRLAEPVSPARYLRPAALSSPSADSSDSDASSGSSLDIPARHARPVVLLSDLGYGRAGESAAEASSDDSDVIEVSVTNRKKEARRYRKSPNKGKSEAGAAASGEVRRSSRVRKCESDSPGLTCAASRRTLRRRVKNDAVGIYNESSDSEDLIRYALSFSSSEESASQPNRPREAGGRAQESSGTRNTDGTAPDDARLRKRRKTLSPPEARKVQKEKQELISSAAPAELQAVSGRTAAGNKRRRKRKRRQHAGASAPFPPREPEVLLKYAKSRSKKDRKPGSFCPFVRVEQQLCRVVNYQDDGSIPSSRGWTSGSGSGSGSVPSTSCFQLGRPGSGGGAPDRLLCCLCGWTANAAGLGDLHGPYCPAGASPDGQTSRTGRNHDGLQKLSNGHLPNSSEDDWTPDGTLLRSHRVSPTKAPLGLCESWIHEDCGVWSAGVFLVRGKLYGLQEAAQIAQEAICSSCGQTGAIMGCFRKGCLRNYHYPCALQSGAVLNEENFSMRCPEHKNKMFPPAARQDRR